MKLGIIGLPQTGKKTIFELLTNIKLNDNLDSKKATPGFAIIRDQRFNELVKLYSPKSEKPALIDIKLFPMLDIKTNGNDILKDLSDVDAICHIVRDFTDEAIYHLNGSVDAKRDIEALNEELILHDLIFIEKRLEKLVKESKKKDEKKTREEGKLLLRFKEHLENDQTLRTLDLDEESKKIISSYPFLTIKKLLVVLNVDDAKTADKQLLNSIAEKYKAHQIDIMQVPAKMELEISSLENEDDRTEYMQELGIEEPALNSLSSLAMKSLDLISFFTVGKDEVKQWLVRDKSLAPEAAGVIHSDIQRGFIRAEVMKYQDIAEQGDEEKVKKLGKLNTMGKDYTVQDGDIINFRFNV